VFFDGGVEDTAKGKVIRGTSDFVGWRGFPQGAFDYLDDGANAIYPGKGYRDLETFQKTKVRDEMADQLRPITERRAQAGDKLSIYYLESDKIDAALDVALQNISDSGRGLGPIAEALGRPMTKSEAKNAYYTQAAAARNQKRGLAAGARVDFNEQKDGETDKNLQALEAYGETFDAATVGNVFLGERWDKLVRALFEKLNTSQLAYVRRNTNLRVIPANILETLSDGTRKRIRLSEAARRQFESSAPREPQREVPASADRQHVRPRRTLEPDWLFEASQQPAPGQ
jgi:hypothetical protein